MKRLVMGSSCLIGLRIVPMSDQSYTLRIETLSKQLKVVQGLLSCCVVRDLQCGLPSDTWIQLNHDQRWLHPFLKIAILQNRL